MVDPTSSLAGDPSEPNESSLADEGIRYLLAFSETMFDLVPDGLAILDDRLFLRAANPAFVEMLSLGSIDEARGRSLADHPWLRDRVEIQGASMPLGDLLLDEFQTGMPVALEGVRAPQGEHAPPLAVRAIPWDTQDPRSRRILLWVGLEQPAPSTPEPPVAEPEPTSLLEEKNDRIFFLTAFLDRVLEVVPFGLCLLDPSLRVVADSAWMREHLRRRNLSESPADRHLFALYPELRGSELQIALDTCRREGRGMRVEITGKDGAMRRSLLAEVEPFLPEANAPGVLLALREVAGESSNAAVASPETPPDTLAGDPFEATAASATQTETGFIPSFAIESPRLLLVERDATERARLSDRLRAAGFEDLAAATSGTDALVRHDPALYAVIVLGFEPWDQEIADYARRAAQDAPHVPIVVVSSAQQREVDRFFGGVPLRRVLPRDDLAEELAHAIREVLAIPAPSAAHSSSGGIQDVILIGAREHDIPVLRLLYRAPGMHLRMIYDPEPDAAGLALGRSLGIPAVAGHLEMRLEPPPDAVVLAREGMEEYLAPLGLTRVPRVTRDEIELFLVDPDAYLASENSPRAIEPREVLEPSEPEEEIEILRTPEPSWIESREIDLPIEEEEPPLIEAPRATQSTSAPVLIPPAPAPSPPPIAAPPAPSAQVVPARTSAHSDLHDEIESLLRALDLLLDFQSLADWVLEVALRLTGGSSGSLMLVQEDRPVLAIMASFGLKDIAARHRRQRVGEGIAGRVAEDVEPLLLVGTVGDPKIKPMGARPEIRSSVSVPVLADGRLLGVLNLNSDPRLDPFDPETLARATEFGKQVGGPLSRSLQLRKMRGRSFEHSMRAEIDSIASLAADLGTKLRQAADRISQVLSSDSCTIYLLDRDRKFLDLEAASGVSTSSVEAYRVPVGVGVVGWVAKNRRPLVLRNPEEEAGDPQPTTMAFPIRHQTDLLGVLALEATQPMASEDDRLALIDSIASAIGALIADARITHDSSKMVTMLSALSELGLAFGAASNPEGLARLVAFTASTVLESDVCLVRLRRPDAPGSDLDDYELLASHGASMPLEVEPLGQLEAKLVARALATGEPCRDLELPLADAEPLLRQSNVFAAMAIPITFSRETLGTIVVARVPDAMGKESAYGDTEVEIGSRLGDYASAAARKFLRNSDRDDDGESGDARE